MTCFEAEMSALYYIRVAGTSICWPAAHGALVNNEDCNPLLDDRRFVGGNDVAFEL